ncbi:MAG: GNAT family N-acetyltransferase [Oscillospiraceae bacterium]|nr:GNAT family N-acetyltransferase [Oscillospiraceae bacterium]
MDKFSVRAAGENDFETICNIYSEARAFMRASGNPNQWRDNRPALPTVERDIQEGKSHVCICESGIAAVFFYSVEDEPTYARIDGAWINDAPYGVIHRLARSRNASASGAGEFCVEWCFAQCGNLRVDTHRDNAPMRNLLGKLGFSYCGVIWLEDGDERLAYQKTGMLAV